MNDRERDGMPPGETAVARALREAQERAQAAGSKAPQVVFREPSDCPEREQEAP